MISDLARSIIGSQRDNLGDLHNLTVEISPINGSGKILPWLILTDNGSGDISVRAE